MYPYTGTLPRYSPKNRSSYPSIRREEVVLDRVHLRLFDVPVLIAHEDDRIVALAKEHLVRDEPDRDRRSHS